MKNLFFLFILFILISCTTDKNVYWCGDHPCINKKEKEAYFKKTMIIEIKDLKNKNYKNDSEINKIMQQAKLSEKERIKSEKELLKQVRLDEKKRIKSEKELLKQVRLDEKKRIKEEKDLTKQIKLEESRRIKDEKRLSKRKIVVNQKKQLKKSVKLDVETEDIKIEPSKFSELIEKITKRNSLRSYPDINDIPN